MRNTDPYFHVAINGHAVPTNGGVDNTIHLGPFTKVTRVDLVISAHTPETKMLWIIVQVRSAVLESITDDSKFDFHLHFHKLPFTEQTESNYRTLRCFINAIKELFDGFHTVGATGSLLHKLFPATTWLFDVKPYIACIKDTVPASILMNYRVFAVDSAMNDTEYQFLRSALTATVPDAYVFRVREFVLADEDHFACLNNKNKILYLMDGLQFNFNAPVNIGLIANAINAQLDMWTLYQPLQNLGNIFTGFYYPHTIFK